MLKVTSDPSAPFRSSLRGKGGPSSSSFGASWAVAAGGRPVTRVFSSRPWISPECHGRSNWYSLMSNRIEKGVQMADSETGPRVLIGKCWCDTVRYRVADAFLYASNCHCSRCRAATGSAFKPFAGIEQERLEITDGQDALLVVGD